MDRRISGDCKRNESFMLNLTGRKEFEKCKYLRHEIVRVARLNGNSWCGPWTVNLRNKMWIHTKREGYEFNASKVVCGEEYGLEWIQVVNDDGGIRCSAYLLDSIQLKKLFKLMVDIQI